MKEKLNGGVQCFSSSLLLKWKLLHRTGLKSKPGTRAETKNSFSPKKFFFRIFVKSHAKIYEICKCCLFLGFYNKNKNCHQYVNTQMNFAKTKLLGWYPQNFRGNGHVRTMFAEFVKFNEFLQNFAFYQKEKGPGTYFAARWRASNLGTAQLKSWK